MSRSRRLSIATDGFRGGEGGGEGDIYLEGGVAVDFEVEEIDIDLEVEEHDIDFDITIQEIDFQIDQYDIDFVVDESDIDYDI